MTLFALSYWLNTFMQDLLIYHNTFKNMTLFALSYWLNTFRQDLFIYHNTF